MDPVPPPLAVELPERPQATPGTLPADGPAEVGGVQLVGRGVGAVRADGTRTAPVLWRSDDPVTPAAWGRLAAAYEQTGLWPLLLEASEEDPARDATTAFGEPDPDGPPAGLRAKEVLEGTWAAELADEPEEGMGIDHRDPFGPAFPGVARASPVPVQPVELEELPDAHLALVPVARPADCLGVARFPGLTAPEVATWRHVVVLRSWEERFAALPVVLGVDGLLLDVRRPLTGDWALVAAAESFAFCPWVVYQGSGTIGHLAGQLDGERQWTFWWDLVGPPAG